MFKILSKLISYIFILTLMTTLIARSEVINKINITGNERIPDETIKMFSGVNINDDITLNDIDKILKNIFNSNFFDMVFN